MSSNPVVKIGFVKAGIRKIDIYCTGKYYKDELFYTVSFAGFGIPGFLFRDFNSSLGDINKTMNEEEWHEYYNKLKEHPMVTMEHETFEDVISAIALEAL